MKIVLTLLLLLLSAPTYAQDPYLSSETPHTVDLDAFARIPVLHDGRVKPIDSFARIILKDIYGAETLKEKSKEKNETLSARAWLLEMITAPGEAIQRDVFRIPSHEVGDFLNIQTKYTNAKALSNAFAAQENTIIALKEKDFETLSQTQQDTLSLYSKLLIFTSQLEGNGLPLADKSDPGKLETELLYNTIKPYRWVVGLYLLTVGIALFAASKPAALFLNTGAFITALLAALTHSAAIAGRVYILDRPPVGTLYESVIFVGLVCMIIALIYALKKPRPLFLVAGSAAAAFLLLIAPTSLAQSESLQTLSAVLNTNFWLMVHVLCITTGYALCILAASLAHIALITNAEKLKAHIYGLSLIALLFTALGTILGGIWADQSWGRFWGWDPKENGALLIVLWLIWLHHGRLSNHIKPCAFLFGIAALNIIVALAWFGVNLLGVGLHAYGFTSGLALGLGLFCAAETLLIAGLYTYNVRTQKS